MNVYSIVPSQRSHATVSIRNSKSIAEVRPHDRADEQGRLDALTSSAPPVASMPFAMKTIVSVFATVQTNQATSHQM